MSKVQSYLLQMCFTNLRECNRTATRLAHISWNPFALKGFENVTISMFIMTLIIQLVTSTKGDEYLVTFC